MPRGLNNSLDKQFVHSISWRTVHFDLTHFPMMNITKSSNVNLMLCSYKLSYIVAHIQAIVFLSLKSTGLQGSVSVLSILTLFSLRHDVN